MHLGLRALGVVLCVAAALMASTVVTLPASLHDVAWAVDPEGGFQDRSTAPAEALAWGDRAIAVAFLQPIRYDETRDLTLAGATFDGGHRPGGPLVWVRGHVEGDGPFLLEPTSPTLSFEEVDASASPFAGRFAIKEPFEARSSMPGAVLTTAIMLAPLALLALFADGRWTRRSLLPAGVAFGGWMGFEGHAAGLGGILFSLIALIAVGSSALMLLILLFWRRRIDAITLTVLAAGLAYFVTIGIAAAYAPHSGAGD